MKSIYHKGHKGIHKGHKGKMIPYAGFTNLIKSLCFRDFSLQDPYKNRCNFVLSEMTDRDETDLIV
jgi:hypothetical protein